MTVSSPQAIAIVRHGETDWNLARRIQGRTEVPLNATGRAQAEATGRLLASEQVRSDWGAWSLTHSSPLGRAIETAQIIGTVLGFSDDRRQPIVDHGLWERDFGMAEGVFFDEAHAQWPNLEGIPGAETPSELADRTAEAFERLLNESPGSVVVAHGAMMRLGLGRLSGTEMPRVLNGEIWVLSRDCAAPHAPRLTSLGTAHPTS